MGISRSLVFFALIVAIAPAMTLATEHMVGDDQGWKLGYDYQNWTMGKQFVVGDTLVFMYNKSAHNVYKVLNATDFQNCTVPTNKTLGSHSGNDTFPLKTAGDKWYICGVTGHCKRGMKLKITVLPVAAPVPAPAPPAPAPPAPPAPAPNSAPALRTIEPIFQIFSGVIFAIVATISVN